MTERNTGRPKDDYIPPRPPDWTVDTLKEYVESRVEALNARVDEADKGQKFALEANRRANDLATEAAREALRRLAEAQHDALDKVEVATRTRISEGDTRLREHVQQQYMQIGAALESARRETMFANEAAQRAIEKVEVATEKRFESVNEFRAQLNDQTSTFVRIDLHGAQMSQVEERLRRIETWQASLAGVIANRKDQQPWAIWAVGAIITIILTIIVMASNGVFG